MEEFDVVIIGAGMAGASLAWALAPRRRVLLLEQESQPGYHSTGRSAATLHRSYGNRTIRALTAASAPFYLDPPAGFSASQLWRQRAVLKVAREDQRAELAENLENTLRFVPEAQPLDRQQCLDLLPALRPDYVAAGLLDPTMLDLDVAAILTGYLKGARAGGVELRTSALVEAIRPDRGAWEVMWRGGAARAAVLVDAAGAWADSVAGLAGLEPLGIVPHRRTAVIVPAPTGVATADWPMVEAIGETWYLKPDAGRLLCSPADETACAPADAQPEELDVAICVDRIEQAFTFPVRRIESRWAGLRCFAPDRTPVVGFDPRAAGFFWLAGQGGYGIQTAPALAALAAALITGEPASKLLRVDELDPAALAPARLLASGLRPRD